MSKTATGGGRWRDCPACGLPVKPHTPWHHADDCPKRPADTDDCPKRPADTDDR